MATYYARKAGNINATDVWATTPSGTAGAQTFVAGDVLVSNNFAITVNVSTDLGSTGEVRNDTTGGATQGGTFTLSNGVTLTAKIICGASATVVATSGTTTATIIGDITGSTGSGIAAVNHNSTGTLNITGTVTASSGANSNAVQNAVAGTVNLTGNAVGGSGGGGQRPDALSNEAGGTINITGNVTGGTNVATRGVSNQQGGTVTITGTVTGGTGTGSSDLAPGAVNLAAGTLTIVGTAVGAGQPGAWNNGTGTMTVTRAKGGPLTSSNVGVRSASGAATSVQEIEFGDLGASPVAGPIRLTDQTSNVAVFYRFGTTKKTLVDTASTSLLPAASNVRSGTVYNAGQTTGTCAVPGASSVLVGVAVDNTVGTAAVSSAAIQSACDAALAAFSSGRLGNVATVASTGQQIADAFGT